MLYYCDMKDSLLFSRKFLKHGLHIASLFPSSSYLAKTTIRGIDWSNARIVLELGAGTGAVTEAILARINPQCRFIAIERDSDFVRVLKRRFADCNIEIVEADACEFSKILEERKINSIDAIVSGLPVSSFSRDLQGKFFNQIARALVPQGSYNQITIMPFLFQFLYKKYFEEVKFLFEPRNLPPGGVYVCRQIKAIEGI